MKEFTYWRIVYVWLVALALTACSAAATTNPGEANSASLPKQTAVPALNPVTPTPETALATANPAATKSASPTSPATDAAADEHAGAFPDDAVLVFERAGGLRGIGPGKMTWTFYADGRVTSSDGRSWQVAPEEIAALMDSLGALGFDTFQASYQPADTCCDLVTYTFRLQLDGEVYETAVMEGANAPQELLQAVDLVNQFLLNLPT